MDSELAWETVARRTAYSCDGFEIRNERVALPDGTETEFDYLSEPESVCILPLTPDDRVVCIEEWRQAVSRVNRGLPVGSTEPDDDSLEAAARRELREETGHEAEDLEHLLTAEPANGIADSVIHFFVASGCRPTAAQQLDDDETIRVAETSLEDLLSEIESGDLRDGRAILAVTYYRLFGE
ncbi:MULTISPECIES: NUDIX hydrolase [Saliphagus]|uniref:NUDIX hydrolase n=1 Tax=Saliphagus infecundisoli TaxID=1849069 RepID=A0ABD5QEX3_9EURY|nr:MULTISPECIES: NUDIX hydrolase [Saliphagus]